jgi:hypothetical protein
MTHIVFRLDRLAKTRMKKDVRALELGSTRFNAAMVHRPRVVA